MTVPYLFTTAFAACPLVAILRGITPAEVDAIGDVLVEAGFTIIEVPLNSPDALVSIERLAERLAGRAVIGGGTVLAPSQVTDVATAGGRIIVSPNTDAAVIARTLELDLLSFPGCYTPTDAFAAIAAGAHGLKFFPADAIGHKAVKGLRAVLPTDTTLLAVGGISPDSMAGWAGVGINGFGIGSALYSAGACTVEVGSAARRFAAAMKALRAYPANDAKL